MGLPTGTRLGPYEIGTPLGAGGMGEVYRARDTRLERTVAIKILPEAFASDPDRLQRFEHEARILSALNHPNLLAIYDVGAHDAVHYLVSEYLEGQTLHERLRGGALLPRRATEYALQIASGLAAAHDKGIVHRDLKPENTFVTRDERTKILDFGLAKQADCAGWPEGDTLTGPAPTAAGIVMGTVGYMSPEQVRGEAAGPRSDIFSFGAVLFEMLTGKPAFKRGTPAETMSAILRDDPPELAESGVQVSPGLQRVVRRCLEKNVERRFQSASDLAFAIESLSTSSVTHSIPASKRSWLPWAAVALALLLVSAMVSVVGRRSGSRPLPQFHRLTYQRGYIPNARFAKDGATVLYSAQWNNDPVQMFSVRAEFPQSVKVSLPSASLLALSSGGDLAVLMDPIFLNAFASGTMALAPMSGGSPRALYEDVIAADYSPDGTTLALVRQAKGKVQLEFPAGKVVYETSGYLDYLRFSRTGKYLAFLEHPVYGDDRGWVSVIDSNGNRRRLTAEFGGAQQGLAWSSEGDEVWFTASNSGTRMELHGVNLQGKMRSILSAPQRIRLLDIAGDGRVLLDSAQFKIEITGADPETGKERAGLEWFDGSFISDILPDGKAFLFFEWGGPSGPLYLVCYRKLDGSPPVALGPGAHPRFSPDGKTAVALLLTTPPKIVLHPIGTGESRQFSLGDITSLIRANWFPDGKHLLIVGAESGHALRTYEMDLEGGKPRPLGPDDWQGVAVSKDGKRIAGWQSTQAAVFNLETKQMQTIPGLERCPTCMDVSRDDLNRWTRDGQGLLFQSGSSAQSRVYRVEAATGKRTLLREIQLNDRAGSDGFARTLVAEGSKTYVYQVRRTLGSLYVVEGLR